jgi:DNA-binding response OmpR family regulator
VNYRHQILIVSSDPQTCASLLRTIPDYVYRVHKPSSFEYAVSVLEQNKIDLLFIDMDTLDIDVVEVCATIRKNGFQAPIIMLSRGMKTECIVQGLDAGANDHIKKSTCQAEILARIRAHIRIFQSSEHATFSIGLYEFKPSVRYLVNRCNQVKTMLTDKESRILWLLLKAQGKVVLRTTLLRDVLGYGDDIHDPTHSLETQIYRLREKMGREPAFVMTGDGGYYLNSYYLSM